MTTAVVVPAHRETERLRLLLAALPPGLRAVVAVDGAHPPTVAVARAAGAEVVELADNRGSYAARNAAVERVLTDDAVDVVLFTDADCVPTPGWAAAHEAALRDADLSGGAVRFTFARRRPTPPEWVDSVRHLQQEHYVLRDGYAATCNLAVRASVLREHRFDDRLRTGGRTPRRRRVTAAGASLAWTPEAVVEHPARTLRELVVKVRRLAGGVAGQADRWRDRPLPSTRLTRGVWRRAQAAGHDVGPVWGVTACVLDWLLTRHVVRAVRRLRRSW